MVDGPPGAPTKDREMVLLLSPFFGRKKRKASSASWANKFHFKNGRNNESACLLPNLVKTLQKTTLLAGPSRILNLSVFAFFSVCVSKRPSFFGAAPVF